MLAVEDWHRFFIAVVAVIVGDEVVFAGWGVEAFNFASTEQHYLHTVVPTTWVQFSSTQIWWSRTHTTIRRIMTTKTVRSLRSSGVMSFALREESG